MKRPHVPYLLRHPRAIPPDLGDPPDAHHAVRRPGGDETPVPADVAEEHGEVAWRGIPAVLEDGSAVGEREDGEFALGGVLFGVGVGGVDGFGVPGADESVAGYGEEELVERVVAELVDETAVCGAGGEVVIARLRGGVGEERRDVPEHDAAVFAAAGEDRVGRGERQIGDFAAMAADGAATREESEKRRYRRLPEWMSQILMRWSSAPVKAKRSV